MRGVAVTDREIGELWDRLPQFLSYRNAVILVNFIRRLIFKVIEERAISTGIDEIVIAERDFNIPAKDFRDYHAS